MYPTLVELKGGLGNQLFQLSAGLVHSRGTTEKLFFDISSFDYDSRHGGYALGRLFPELNLKLVRAKKFSVPYVTIDLNELPDFDATFISELNAPVRLVGYFQNYRMISRTLPFLRSEFAKTYGKLLPKTNSEVEDNSKYVISLHLRRGDYMAKEVRGIHGIPSLEDVRKALENELVLVGRNVEPYIQIFSDTEDEPIGVQGNVKKRIRSKNSLQNDVDDLIEMANSDTIICANSTYSYWAGLLSTRVRRLVLPTPWMKSEKIRTVSLIPPEIGSLYRCKLT